MMNPEMMKMAQEMMSKMSPEQIAEMQRQAANMDPSMMQQAMNMANTMTPEQLRQMQESMPPGAMPGAMPTAPPRSAPSSGAGGVSSMSPQQKYQYDASMTLKTEGNKLYGGGQYTAAADKYQRAVSNLSGHASADAVSLRATCQSNLASCYLQLERWQDCVAQCDAVLQADPSNRKAYYRRGQAKTSLGNIDAAVRDLQRALDLSPENEKGVIKAKLDAAQKQQSQKTVYKQGDVVIEEVTEPASEENVKEGVNVEASDDDEMPGLIPESALAAAKKEAAAKASAAASDSNPSFQATPEMVARMQQLEKDPIIMKQQIDAFANMSSEEIAAGLAASGTPVPPGFTPEMAKAAAEMMKNMPPEQIQAVAKNAAQLAGNGDLSAAAAAAMPAMSSMPVPPPPAAGPLPASLDSAAAQAFMRDPNNLKSAMKMMDNMSEDQLEAMAAAMPDGAPPGGKLDIKQMKMAAKMMENMTPEDLEALTKIAGNLGATPPTAPGGDVTGSSPSVVSGMPPTMDPSKLMQNMSDPATLRAMQNMMKSVDNETLAGALKASGLNVDVDQAKKMIDTMGNVSDKHLEWVAWIVGVLQKIYALFMAAKQWATSNGALALAILVLIIAVLLRWQGYV